MNLENFVDSILKKKLSITLYEYRIENDISRKELASVLDLSLNAITSIENGKSVPSLETLNRYSNYFNTSISRIIERAENHE